MGMGEPLANYDRTWAAVERIHDDLGLSARHLTVSTVGVVPGIRRLAREALPVNLAVSLHAADDALRDELVPLNRRYPLDVLADACRRTSTPRAGGSRSSGRSSTASTTPTSRPGGSPAIARPLGAHVNLIPLNPTPGYADTRVVARARSARSATSSRALGVNATVRRNRGTDIDAACGQLRATAVALDRRT